MKHALSIAVLLLAGADLASAQLPPGEVPALGRRRITQDDIVNGKYTLDEIRAAGLKMFATPFNKLDGYGDGPVDPLDTKSPGHRPTLQNNGTFLRVNGLDAQTCMECHSVGSFATAPFRFGVGGVGGSNNNVLFQPTSIDVGDTAGKGFADFNGRYINPPFLFGSGGIELLGKEMTAELQALAASALANPGLSVALVTHGVSFGSIRYDAGSGQFDTTSVEGVDADLVVRPFGRKGEFPSVRAFDIEALSFHFGMQAVELVGADVDGDGDGVDNEALIGELSALHIFNTNLERPTQSAPQTAGAQLFQNLGCAACHVPFIDTASPILNYAFPEVLTDPDANIFYSVDLTATPAGFDLAPTGGIRVPAFSDLKRHEMGPALAESFGGALDAHFITARLWGIADTAPYLHDGRATTLTEAILFHGGEAEAAKQAFDALTALEKVSLLEFLRSLRTPVKPAEDILG